MISSILKLDLRKSIDTQSKSMIKWSGTNTSPMNYADLRKVWVTESLYKAQSSLLKNIKSHRI